MRAVAAISAGAVALVVATLLSAAGAQASPDPDPVETDAAAGMLAEHAHDAAPASLEDDAARHEGEPRLAVRGRLELILPEAELGDDGHEHLPETDQPVASVLTEEGTRIRLEAAPAGAGAGAVVALELALPAALLAEAGERAEEAAAESAAEDEPLTEQDEAGAVAAAVAEEQAEPLPVVAAQVAEPAPAQRAPALEHRLYIAVVGPKGGAAHGSFADAAVRSLVAQVGDYWTAQSGGVISRVGIAGLTRYTSAIDCGSGMTSVTRWWDEAGPRFNADPDRFFAPGTGRHLVVLTPDGGDSCRRSLGFVGLGTLGETSDDGGLIQSLVGTRYDAHTLAHELGHNIGLGHANVHTCEIPDTLEGTRDGAGPWAPTGCRVDPYLDQYDVMGFSIADQPRIPSLSAPGLDRLGFLGDDSREVLALPAGQSDAVASRTIRAIGTGSGPRVLRIVEPGTGVLYWVELRTPVGQDAGIKAMRDAAGFCGKGSCATEDGYATRFGDGIRILKLDPSRSTAPDTLALTSQHATSRQGYRDLAIDTDGSWASRSGRIRLDVEWSGTTSARVRVELSREPKLGAAPLGAAIAKDGARLTVVRARFRLPGVTTTTRWYVDGQLRATGTSLTPTAADSGRQITARVTASRAGFADGVAETPAIRWTSGWSERQNHRVRLMLTAEGAASGQDAEGEAVIIADTGNLPAAGTVRFLDPATGGLYPGTWTLDEDGTIAAPLPAGLAAGTRELAVRWTQAGTGLALDSAPVPLVVGRGSTTASLDVVEQTAAYATLRARIGGWRGLAPTGVLLFTAEGRTLARAALEPGSGGVITVHVPTRDAANREIAVTYLGDESFRRSTSPAATIGG
ncbi:hypothetical protein [Homoserinibacter sp. YIM 151385]|uniref:hypothetical protein n=1 Tax=Homoserinibacter sp. YIM 151385 TaxID=2985506 RepID=UPI0022F01C8E|nr:hypothetical protein [Homoserinibacter sp. YIM 151385]WBU37368.1 hypothetical protein OF852_10650 [Homoserinibacter sp. YIM 151385]